MSMNRRFILSAIPASIVTLGIPSASAASASGLGIIFVGQSTCPYCAAAAPVLEQLHRDVGIPVIVASMDGLPVYPFAHVQDARANPLTSHYASVPQVLVYNQRLDRVTHEFGGFRNMRHFINQLSSALRQASQL